jgi:hypothetical protein
MQTYFSETKPIHRHRLIRRAKEAISTELDGETVILHIGTGIYSGLDRVGTTIWNSLEQPASFLSLKQKILKEYEVSEQQCITDLCSFLNDLINNQLIIVEDEQIL